MECIKSSALPNLAAFLLVTSVMPSISLQRAAVSLTEYTHYGLSSTHMGGGIHNEIFLPKVSQAL